MKYIQYPNEAFDYLQDKSLVVKVIRYAINHKNIRNTIWLKPWLENQVGEALGDKEFVAWVQKVVGQEKDYDKIVIKILRKCMNRYGFLKYVTDNENWDSNEYWQTYRETFDMQEGDCEDGAVFMYVACRIAGIPSNRLLLMAGSVYAPGARNNEGGHCWLAYRPTYDPLNFRFLDWCYWGNIASVQTRPSFYIGGRDIYPVQGNEERYYRIWWCFNEDNTYSSIIKTY